MMGVDAFVVRIKRHQLGPERAAAEAGITPKKPSCSVTGKTSRIGCSTLPAERSRNAPAIAGMSSSIRKCERTSSSSRNMGGMTNDE